ncbi:T9SS type B sorting domain-containing protein [Flavobacterium luteum]|uniref:T9SS type B sorting domain-containing protein n=1 Tax=Flavobacterium luteum TaxID=2026654 RepID=A0A7J5ABC8_9FLAO|nr:T9SS type B sorting domain-containing protein [Flavobacterium luteum]KAB1154835.1 T9SS type B sorting domain-containing protein [Flavobacterium luteum]
MTNFKIPFLVLILVFSSKIISQNDCSKAIVVCGNSGFEGLTASGIGKQEISGANSCDGDENNSIWLRLSIKTAGTLGFTLIPESTDINEDFDFFIFGPKVTCGAIGQAIRCSTTNPESINQPNNYTGMNATSNDISEGPGPDGNSFVKWLTVAAGDSYFLVIDRPSGSSNFKLQWSGTATFDTPPTFDMPTGVSLDIKQCDTDGFQDFISDFNLKQNEALIIGTQSNVLISYHTSQNDALTNVKEIKNATSFKNTSNPQTIYVRIENTITGCFNTSSFIIEVNDSVNLPKNEASICDDITDGNDTNGLSTFDLTKVTATIFDNQDTTAFTIKYYLSKSDANLNLNELPQFFSNTKPNKQPIFIKVFDGTCSGTKEINLIVIPVPTKIKASGSQCDFGLNPDGLSLFDLNDYNSAFAGSDPNLSVTYFKNKTQEQNNTPLVNIFNNTSNPETIIGRITNAVTGCYSLSDLTLNVNLAPSQNIKPLDQCDILNQENGFATFNLDDATLVVTPTQIKSFYSTQSDALLKQNNIPNPTNYTIPFAYNSSVFIRIDDAGNCTSVSEVQLIVNKLPKIETLSDEKNIVCSNIPNRFITINAGKLETSSANFNYTWYRDGIDIKQSTYAIKVNREGTYTVDVANRFGCFKTRTITVTSSEIASITDVKVSDFTESNTVEVLLKEDLKGDYVFSLYKSDDFQTSNIFTDVPAGVYELYVKDLNGCGVFGPKIISVLGAPKFFTPNNDGVNDLWYLKGVGSNFSRKSFIQIFNREGKLLYEMNARDKGWDGTYNSNPSPSDDYWYVITLENNKTIKGHFSLKR